MAFTLKMSLLSSNLRMVLVVSVVTNIKPTALANVHAFYQRLKPEIQIIGTGGVKSGRDAFEHILCGASMVQVGTALQKEGVAVFDRITKELKEIMEEKGYETLEDFRGKLHYID